MATYRELVIDPLRRDLADVESRLAKWADRGLMARRASLIASIHEAEIEEEYIQDAWNRRYAEAMDDPTGQDLEHFLED